MFSYKTGLYSTLPKKTVEHTSGEPKMRCQIPRPLPTDRDSGDYSFTNCCTLLKSSKKPDKEIPVQTTKKSLKEVKKNRTLRRQLKEETPLFKRDLYASSNNLSDIPQRDVQNKFEVQVHHLESQKLDTKHLAGGEDNGKKYKTGNKNRHDTMKLQSQNVPEQNLVDESSISVFKQQPALTNTSFEDNRSCKLHSLENQQDREEQYQNLRNEFYSHHDSPLEYDFSDEDSSSSSNESVPDIYRRFLGPTVDESILVFVGIFQKIAQELDLFRLLSNQFKSPKRHKKRRGKPK